MPRFNQIRVSAVSLTVSAIISSATFNAFAQESTPVGSTNAYSALKIDAHYQDETFKQLQAAAKANTGTGKKNHKLGKLNQRAAILASNIGVHTLTTTITSNSNTTKRRLQRCAIVCNSPSVFIINQVEPNKA